MKKLTYWLMIYQLKCAEKSFEKETHSIVKKAKEHRLQAYKSAVLFLNS